MVASSVLQSPLFLHAKADIILRSSDGVDFRIEGDLPIVSVEENHRVLDIWLRFCYPSTLAEDPPLNDIEDIIPVLEAARKYSLKPLEHKVRQALRSPALAAEYTLRQSLIPVRVPEIDLITAKELLALLTYHQRCGIRYQWIISGSCNCEPGSQFLLNGQQPLKWWSDYMEKNLTSLFDKPSGHTVLACVSDAVRGVRAAGCSQCCSNILVNMTEFAQLFSMKVATLTAKVRDVFVPLVNLDMTLINPFIPPTLTLPLERPTTSSGNRGGSISRGGKRKVKK
ncbi:hypothetical protein DFH29DRAFT_976466 [Suillus ampliporus]|nr:hypothetical protein DFH29DRAFT_976466 [Suillus ampliporus]